MTEKRKKLAVLLEFNKVCKEAIMAQPKPNRSHRRRLEAYRSKIHALQTDPDFKGVVENQLKILNVVQHYSKSGDDHQLAQSMGELEAESAQLFDELSKKYQ